MNFSISQRQNQQNVESLIPYLGRGEHTKFGPRPVLVYKVLLEDSQAQSLHIVCGCFHTTEAELSIDRETWPAKPKTFTVWLFIENICFFLRLSFL